MTTGTSAAEGVPEHGEPLGHHGAHHPTPHLLLGDQAGVGEKRQVVTDGRLALGNRLLEIAAACRALGHGGDERQEPETNRVRQHLERSRELGRALLVERGREHGRAAGFDGLHVHDESSLQVSTDIDTLTTVHRLAEEAPCRVCSSLSTSPTSTTPSTSTPGSSTPNPTSASPATRTSPSPTPRSSWCCSSRPTRAAGSTTSASRCSPPTRLPPPRHVSRMRACRRLRRTARVASPSRTSCGSTAPTARGRSTPCSRTPRISERRRRRTGAALSPEPDLLLIR